MKAIRYAHSLILVWQIAEIEARRQLSATISPTHFFLGLCKVIDLDLDTLLKDDDLEKDEILEDIHLDVRALRKAFKTAGVRAKPLRRCLRALLEKPRIGIPPSQSGRLHRNSDARNVFLRAHQIARIGDGVIRPIHILYFLLVDGDPLCELAMKKLEQDWRRLLIASRNAVLPKTAGGRLCFDSVQKN